MTLGGIAVAVGSWSTTRSSTSRTSSADCARTGCRPTPDPPLKVVLLRVERDPQHHRLCHDDRLPRRLPLFALAGIEGRMFGPLGVAYIDVAAGVALVFADGDAGAGVVAAAAGAIPWPPRGSVAASLAEASRWRRWFASRVRHPWPILGTTLVLGVASKVAVLGMGAEFLPPFNEGTLTINVQSEPGTSLAESERIAGRVEAELLRVPEVVSIGRRTGRAEMDEHAEGVHALRDRCPARRASVGRASGCWPMSANASAEFRECRSTSGSRSRIGSIISSPACGPRWP